MFYLMGFLSSLVSQSMGLFIGAVTPRVDVSKKIRLFFEISNFGENFDFFAKYRFFVQSFSGKKIGI